MPGEVAVVRCSPSYLFHEYVTMACPHCYCTSQLLWKMAYAIPGILFVGVLLTELLSVFIFHIL